MAHNNTTNTNKHIKIVSESFHRFQILPDRLGDFTDDASSAFAKLLLQASRLLSMLHPQRSTLHASTRHTPRASLRTPHFTLHPQHSTLQTAHFTPDSTLRTPHCTLHNQQSTIFTAHSTLYTPHSTLHCPHHTQRYTLYALLPSLSFILPLRRLHRQEVLQSRESNKLRNSSPPSISCICEHALACRK